MDDDKGRCAAEYTPAPGTKPVRCVRNANHPDDEDHEGRIATDVGTRFCRWKNDGR